MSDQQYNDEIDLGVVFQKIKDGFKQFLIFIYSIIQFFLKYAIVIIVLLIVGAVIGYFLNKQAEPVKEATLVVHNNYDATSYVYSAVELLNRKVAERDSVFLVENGFKLDENGADLLGIKISPIVNVVDLISRTQVDPRSLEAFFNEIKYEEDLLSSEAFYTEYQKHKIKITTSSSASNQTIKRVIEFLGNNAHLKKLRTSYLDDINARIVENKVILKQIDTLIKRVKTPQTSSLPSSIYIDSQEDAQLNDLILTKREVIKENESLRSALIRSDDIILLLNNPKLTVVKQGLLANKMIILPVLLIGLFVAVVLCIRFYTYLKKLSQSHE
ncbi:hypothetical protein GCM10009117_18990 [Gangjinia marincola]|uniref:Polysaccharide chain length determinant N-terminal domain-containing protein n=1 Tax=Gangjinia marincola TaxID=578463 RepID=A0ABP3XWH3_9FLAO